VPSKKDVRFNSPWTLSEKKDYESLLLVAVGRRRRRRRRRGIVVVEKAKETTTRRFGGGFGRKSGKSAERGRRLRGGNDKHHQRVHADDVTTFGRESTGRHSFAPAPVDCYRGVVRGESDFRGGVHQRIFSEVRPPGAVLQSVEIGRERGDRAVGSVRSGS